MKPQPSDAVVDLSLDCRPGQVFVYSPFFLPGSSTDTFFIRTFTTKTKLQWWSVSSGSADSWSRVPLAYTYLLEANHERCIEANCKPRGTTNWQHILGDESGVTFSCFSGIDSFDNTVRMSSNGSVHSGLNKDQVEGLIEYLQAQLPYL